VAAKTETRAAKSKNGAEKDWKLRAPEVGATLAILF
jgi:hypothetical protein